MMKAQADKVTFANSVKWIRQRQIAVAYLLAVLTWWPLLAALDGRWQGDTSIYHDDADGVLQGRAPYRDITIEYPPYAIPIFLAPDVFGDGNYLDGFRILAAVCELLIRGGLFWVGAREANQRRRWLPLLCYVLATPFLRVFLFQRYDLWPALICLVAALLFQRGKVFSSGLLVAAGIGVKVYPALFVPPLFMLALSRGRAWRFSIGLTAGLAPMAFLAFVMPWWRFVQFQSSRGLQCESLFASVIWGLHRMGLVEARWLYVFRWFEVQGPMASALLPWAKAVFVLTVLLSVASACLAAARMQSPSLGRLARLLLVPLLGFVAFNQVLSPQYMIWLLPMAALATLEGNPWPPLAVALATMLTPIIFPSFAGDYGSGLNGWETLVLIARNLILVAIWWMLVVEHWRLWRDRNSEKRQPNAVASV